ncbi:MAG TPA: hypothetical protein PLF22_05575 [Pseudomonadales bacterium]|nr:hypothetical protein [Pseudomonadales bacterium]
MNGLTKPERYLKGLLLLALVMATGVFLATLSGSIRFLRPGPGFDYWTGAMPFLKSAVDGPFQWPLLWEMYGGAYSMVLGRLMFLAEWYLGNFRNYWMLGSEWLALIATGAIALRAVWQETNLDTASRYLCVVLVILACGSGQHMNNLSYTFNAPSTGSVVYCLLFIVGVYQSVTHTEKSFQVRGVLLSTVSAVLLAASIFSLPSLFATWCALALAFRLHRRNSLLVAALITAATLLYASQMPPVGVLKTHFTLGIGPQAPGDVTVWTLFYYIGLFVLQYVGAPAAEYSMWIDTLFGAVCVAGLLCFLWKKILVDEQPASLLVWLVLGYTAYLLSLALCTAIGRVGSDAMIAPRYRSYVMPLLMFAGIAAVYVLQNCKTWWRTAGSACLIVIAFAVVLPAHNRLLQQFSKEYDDYVTPFVAMSLGITHSDVVHQARWGVWWAADNKQMLEYRDFLRDHRKAIYAEPYFRQVGQSLSLPVAAPDDTRLPSVIERLPGGGYQWKSTTETCDADGRIALVNEQGLVVGAGLVSRAMPDKDWRVNYEVFLPLCQKNYPAAWIAYLPVGTRAGEKVTAVAFDGGKPVVLARAVMP